MLFQQFARGACGLFEEGEQKAVKEEVQEQAEEAEEEEEAEVGWMGLMAAGRVVARPLPPAPLKTA